MHMCIENLLFLGLQEETESLLLVAFPAESKVCDILERIVELRRAVKQSRRLIDLACKEYGLHLIEGCETFKPNSRRHSLYKPSPCIAAAPLLLSVLP